MIHHFVMMRLKDGIFDRAAEQDYIATFDAIREALPEDVLDVRVSRNCIDRPQNMTVLIELLLRDETSLPKYLQHPLHKAIGERYNPHVEQIASFDCEADSLEFPAHEEVYL
ncbi:MAG: Dabb family protein [Clostridia bacterium]|nr:Dabb family protein [Clostridia bacterium]MBR1686257.1 Dabb family protein [Clostridia bacterium]MBR2287537.1 Dabb family protein [Clostridia bacterium]